jgi:hypothetical protein
VLYVRDLWVARLYISERTAEKISQLHGISHQEVRDAVECVSGLMYVWHDHPERGLRAIVDVRIRSRRALVVLYPRHDHLGDAYNLGSAYFIGT